MPNWNWILSRFNLSRQQSQGRNNTVEVVNEYDDSSGDHLYDGSEDCTLRYSYERIDNKICIKPEMPYLSLLSQGGPIFGLPYVWSPFKWQFPKLSIKMVNTSDNALLLSEAVIKVTSSKINVEPILVIKDNEYNVGHFLIVNEGWGQVINPVICFRITKMPLNRGSFLRFDESESEAAEQTVRIDTFTEKVNVSIMDYVPKSLRDEYIVAVSGSIQYSTEAQENHVIKFKTRVSLVMPGPGIYGPPTHLYDLFLKAGESNYTKYLPISQEIKPGDSDHFLIRIASDKSARFNLTFSFRTTGGKEIAGNDVDLDLFVPRSQRGK